MNTFEYTLVLFGRPLCVHGATRKKKENSALTRSFFIPERNRGLEMSNKNGRRRKDFYASLRQLHFIETFLFSSAFRGVIRRSQLSFSGRSRFSFRLFSGSADSQAKTEFESEGGRAPKIFCSCSAVKSENSHFSFVCLHLKSIN